MLPPLIHLGANKTGSTSLQRLLFRRHPRLVYFGEEGPRDQGPRARAFLHEDEEYADVAGFLQLVRAKARVASCTRKRLVFSSEDYCSSPVLGQATARLYRAFPRATIVLVVREPVSALTSWYTNHGAFLKGVPYRYWRKFVRSEEWCRHLLQFPRYGPLEFFRYERFVRILLRHYPASSLRVLVYEESLRQPEKYASRWAEALGIPAQDISRVLAAPRIRVSNNRWQLLFHQLASGLPVSFRRAMQGDDISGETGWKWLACLPGSPVRLPAVYRRQFHEYYRASNRYLEKTLGLDLKAYGYGE